MKQLLKIETHDLIGPWKASSIAAKFPELGRPLSFRAVDSAVQEQKVYFSIELRDASVVESAGTLAELQSMWAEKSPSRATLLEFGNLLSSVGGSVKYLSPDWKTMICFGTAAAIANLPVISIRIDVDANGSLTGGANIAGGTGLEGTGVGMMAGAPSGGPLAPEIFGAGLVVFGAGLVLEGIGLYQLWDAQQPYEIPEVTIVGQDPNAIPEVEIVGQIPDNLTPDNVIVLDPIVITDIPDQPAANGGGDGDGD